jgi:hypothetical protein
MFLLQYEGGVDMMTIDANDPILFAKRILYYVIPNMNDLVFVSKGSFNGSIKSGRTPVGDELFAKIKSKFCIKSLFWSIFIGLLNVKFTTCAPIKVKTKENKANFKNILSNNSSTLMLEQTRD